MKDLSISTSIKPTFTSNCTQSPHCLMHLSTTEWSRVKHNSIIVEGLFGTDLKSYDDVKLGKNVKSTLKAFYLAWKCYPLERN